MAQYWPSMRTLFTVLLVLRHDDVRHEDIRHGRGPDLMLSKVYIKDMSQIFVFVVVVVVH